MVNWIGPLIGAISVGLLLYALFRQHRKARHECIAFLAEYADRVFLRFAYTDTEWSQFLCYERRRHRRFLEIWCGVCSIIPILLWIAVIVSGEGARDPYAWGATGAGVVAFLMGALFRLAIGHYFQWALHRGDVCFFKHGIVIGDVLLSWRWHDYILRNICLSNERAVIELHLMEPGHGIDSPTTEVYEFPVPRAQQAEAAKAVRSLRDCIGLPNR